MTLAIEDAARAPVVNNDITIITLNSGWDRRKIPNLLKLENYKHKLDCYHTFGINDTTIKIIAEPIDQKDFEVIVKDLTIVVIAPIKCQSKVLLKAATILLLAPIECVANRVFLICTKKIVAFADTLLPPNVKMKGDFKRCPISNFNLERIIDQLRGVTKSRENHKILFNGLMQLWIEQRGSKEEATYDEVLEFFDIKYDDFRPEPDNKTVTYCALNPKAKVHHFRKEFEDGLKIKFSENDDILKAYDALSEDMKDHIVAALLYANCQALTSGWPEEGSVSSKYLESVGLTEKSDLKKPVWDYPNFIKYSDALQFLNNIRACWISSARDLNRAEIEEAKNFIGRVLSSGASKVKEDQNDVIKQSETNMDDVD